MNTLVVDLYAYMHLSTGIILYDTGSVLFNTSTLVDLGWIARHLTFALFSWSLILLIILIATFISSYTDHRINSCN